MGKIIQFAKYLESAAFKDGGSVKGSLHTAIFSKYTELLQLKNIFRILWNYFWNILEINVFQNKNQTDGIVNNCWSGCVTEQKKYKKVENKGKGCVLG